MTPLSCRLKDGECVDKPRDQGTKKDHNERVPDKPHLYNTTNESDL
jgi:hypothetical protein